MIKRKHIGKNQKGQKDKEREKLEWVSGYPGISSETCNNQHGSIVIRNHYPSVPGILGMEHLENHV